MKKIWILLWICSWTSFLFGQGTNNSIRTYEYWFDTDFENKISGETSDRIITLSFDIETKHLSEGMHLFNFRAQDTDGRWSSPITKYFYCFQEKEKSEIRTYEYWFDTDFDNKKTDNCNGQFSQAIDMSPLSNGMHSLNIRFKDNRNQWSSPAVHYFYCVKEREPNEITVYEYWFDTDYAGCRRGESDGVLSQELDVVSLSEGMHFLNVRFKDNRGQWSSPAVHYFYCVKERDPNEITAYEYWFDTDYAGCRRGESGGVFSRELDVASLSEGMHSLNVRFKDNRGQWSSPAIHYFYCLKEQEPNEIVAYEYWVDENGFDGRKFVDVSDGILSLSLDFRQLDNGYHTLFFRVKDKLGQWSSPLIARFEKIDGIIPDIPEVEYAILCQLYEKTGGKDVWTEKWDTEEILANDDHWKGVSFDEDGHVVAITLPGNNLKGILPKEVFGLPNLLRLDVSQNPGIGGRLEEVLRLEKPNGTLQEIRMQRMGLSGYVPDLANLSGLKVADFSQNWLDSISPDVKVEQIGLNGQSIRIEPIDLMQYPELALPAISRYDAKEKTFAAYPNFKGMNASGKNGILFTYDPVKRRYLVKNDRNGVDLRLDSDEAVTLVQLNGAAKDSRAEGFAVNWQAGDACVDEFSETNRINVLDALLTAQHAVGLDLDKEDNDPGLLFNVLAADVYTEDEQPGTVNVQDVVSIVNLVLETPMAKSGLLKSAMESPNSLRVEAGKLLLQTTVPVAALDLLLSGCRSPQFQPLVSADYMVAMRDTPDGLRVLILSLAGETLPAGEMEIAAIKASSASLSAAMVASDKSAKIPVMLNRKGVATGIEMPEAVRADNLSMVMPTGAVDGHIRIYNLFGQCVKHERLTDLSVGQKDLRSYYRGLPDGVYIVRIDIRTDKGVSVTNKKLNHMN